MGREMGFVGVGGSATVTKVAGAMVGCKVVCRRKTRVGMRVQLREVSDATESFIAEDGRAHEWMNTTGADDENSRQVVDEKVPAELAERVEETVQEASFLTSTFNYLWPRAMLLFVSAAYGTNFGVVKLVDESVRSSASAALRFGLAALFLAPALLKAPRGLINEGLKIGGYVFAGYFFQSLALQSTEANKIAFLSSLAVVFVPLLNLVLPKSESGEKQNAPLLAIVLAISGVGLLELGDGSTPNMGDFYGLLQGFFFSCGFVLNERATEKYPNQALGLSAAQLCTVGLASLAWYVGDSAALYGTFDLAGIQVAASEPLILASILYTGLITTALAVCAENTALRYVSASELTVLLSTEPFIAAACSAFLLNESLSSNGLTGGVMIIGACLVSQFWDPVKTQVTKLMPAGLSLPRLGFLGSKKMD